MPHHINIYVLGWNLMHTTKSRTIAQVWHALIDTDPCPTLLNFLPVVIGL